MNEQITKLWNDPRRPSVIIGLVALNVGIGLGYILGKRNKFEVHTLTNPMLSDLKVDDLDEIRNRKIDIPPPNRNEVQRVIVSPPLAKVIEGEKFVEDVIKDKTIVIEQIETESDEELVTRSVFANPTDEWNYELELRNRTPNAPYVIHKDEFYSEEAGYTQSTLTYYAGDNILCDEDDAPVYNHEQVTGPLLFGHGSGDPNVVHIRNDKRKAEYEVLFDPGLYSTEVLGLEIENNTRVEDLKHDRYRKFRPE